MIEIFPGNKYYLYDNDLEEYHFELKFKIYRKYMLRDLFFCFGFHYFYIENDKIEYENISSNINKDINEIKIVRKKDTTLIDINSNIGIMDSLESSIFDRLIFMPKVNKLDIEFDIYDISIPFNKPRHRFKDLYNDGYMTTGLILK